MENQSNAQDYGSAMQGTTVVFMETVSQEVERYEERVNNFYPYKYTAGHTSLILKREAKS